VVVKPVKDAQNIFMPTPDAKNAVNVDQTKVCQSSNIYFKRSKSVQPLHSPKFRQYDSNESCQRALRRSSLGEDGPDSFLKYTSD